MADPGDLLERVNEFAPHAAARAEHFAATRGQLVEAAPPLTGLLHPSAGDPALFLELVQEGIERRRLEAQFAAGSVLDDLRELISMAIGAVEDRQYQEFGAALLERLGGEINRC